MATINAWDNQVLAANVTFNGGTMSMGTDATDNAINIATAANAGRTLSLGSATGTSGIVERVGTGNYSLDGAAGSTYTIGASTTTGTVTIGGTAQTGTMTLGSSSGTNIVNIANGAGASTVNIANVQVAGAVNVGAAMTTGTISIGGTGLQTGTITIGGGTGAQIVNLATGGTGVKTVHIADSAVANVITIGSTTGAASLTERVGTGNYSLDGVTNSTYTIGASTTTGTITIGGTAQTGTMTLGSSSGTNIIAIGAGAGATDVQIANAQVAGSVEIGAAMTTGTISIGGTGLQTGTITFGGGTGAQIVNVGTGATGVKTINVGTSAVANVITVGTVTGAASLALKSGTGNIASNAGFTVNANGLNYNTKQSAFAVYQSTSPGNVTGDGTAYTIAANTKIFDQNTDFSTSTFTFTAPITGRYYLFYYLLTTGEGAQTTYQMQIVTTGNTLNSAYLSPTAIKTSGNIGLNMSGLFAMTAADTATFVIIVTGGTKTVGIDGSISFTQVGGNLVC